jgi:hypothetical protein
MTREATCAERIGEQMASREQDLEPLFRAYDGEPNVPDPDGSYTPGEFWDGQVLDAETAGDRLAELPLAVTVERSIRIELSTGGPADYVTAVIDPESGEILRQARYHFADWFDHAEQPIPEDSPLWRLAEHYGRELAESGMLGDDR